MLLARRLTITLLVPVALWVVGEHVLLPGVSADLMPRGRDQSILGIFALGVTPIVSAYWIVELTAIVVPRLQHLRREGPLGRATLERASFLLGAAFALLQAFGMAMSLQGLGDSERTPMTFSMPVIVATLAGGVCIQVVAARLISRQGIANGFLALTAAQLLREALPRVEQVVHDEGSRVLALRAAGLLITAATAWVTLQGAASLGEVNAGSGASPYRDAPRFSFPLRIPIPASSFQVLRTAAALLMLPATFAGFHLPFERVALLLNDDTAYSLAWLAVAGLTMVFFAALLHRPADIAGLAERLGAANARDLENASDRELRRALVPSFLALVAVFFAGEPTIVGASLVVLLVAMVMDAGHALRPSSLEGEEVVVCEERRAVAVPMLRAALAAEGIASDVRGAATLACFQVFAPYAPAQIVVASAGAERATQMLSRLLVGGAAPTPRAEKGSAWKPDDTSWPLARRTWALCACLLAAAAVTILIHQPTTKRQGPRASLALVRVDDGADVFAKIQDEEIPDESGISIYRENVPLGPGEVSQTHWARIMRRERESPANTLARLRAWTDTLRVEPGLRIGFQRIDEYDKDGKLAPETIGWRTFVLRGEDVLRTDDVVEAAVVVNDERPYVTIKLSSDGATRFESATRDWLQRRMAIIVDGTIVTAPVIKTAIKGGRLSITVGLGDHDTELAEARELAARLSP